MTWIYFEDRDGSRPVLDAFKAANVGGALGDGLMRLAEINHIIELARHGELIQDDDTFKPVALDPHIWELPFSWQGHEYRLYYGEPTGHPFHLVALHFHHKDVVEGDRFATAQRQNTEIYKAIARFKNGEAWNWPQIHGGEPRL